MAIKFSLPTRRPARDVVGLDIEPGFVAAAEASVNGSLAVHRAAGAPLELDVVRDGEVLNEEALTAVLSDLFARSHLGRNVRLGVANQRTVLRTIELPPITDAKELAAAVRFQAQDEVPMPLHNAVLDFQPLGIVETPAGPRQRVVLVAAQRDMIERLLSAVRAAGLRPVGVDLAAFAMIRSLYRPGQEGRVVYLGVGGLTNMAVADGATCRFTRVLGGGLEAIAGDVAGRREIALAEARDLLTEVGLVEADQVTAPAPAEAAFEPAEPVLDPAEPVLDPAEPVFDPAVGFAVEPEDDDAADVVAGPAFHVRAADVPAPVADPDADVRRAIAAGVREIAGEVRNSLDFQQAHDGGERVTGVILSGPVLEVPGFAEALELELGLPVEPRSVDGAGAANVAVSPQRLTVATGLAIEVPRS